MAKFLTLGKDYDPSEVKLILGGYSPFGFAPDTKIVVSKAEDLILPVQGTDGDTSIARNRNTLGTMTISLQNTSPSNGILASMDLVARTTGSSVFPVIMEDPTGMALISTFGWIQTQPDYSVAQTVGQMDWVIGIADATLSGNITGAALGTIGSFL